MLISTVSNRPISNELKRLSTTTTSFENHRSPPPPPPSKKFKPNGFGRSKTSSSSNDDVDVNGGGYKFGDVLKVFRVNMKDLKKRDEYQVSPFGNHTHTLSLLFSPLSSSLSGGLGRIWFRNTDSEIYLCVFCGTERIDFVH